MRMILLTFWLWLVSLFLFSCATAEKTIGLVGVLTVLVLILVIAAVIGIIMVYKHNKDKIASIAATASQIKDAVTGASKPTGKS